MIPVGAFEAWIDRPGRDVRAAVLTRPYEFRSPFAGEPFVLLLVVCDPLVTDAEQTAICHGIVRSGCRWVCCAGHDGSAWDDAVDWSDLAMHDFKPPDAGVMTTWHDRDTPAEIVDFLVDDTRLDGTPARRYVVAFVGDDPRLRMEYEAAVRSRFPRQAE